MEVATLHPVRAIRGRVDARAVIDAQGVVGVVTEPAASTLF